MAGAETYPPINTLKPVAPDVWIVDGPVIRFGPPWPKMPFSTRMTIVRLAGGLFVHSPTPLTPELRSELTQIGLPRWIVAPNRIHYWWVPEWAAAFPSAAVYLAPRVREQAKGLVNEGRPLERSDGYPWDADIATLPIAGSYMTEVEFFHHASRTLILTDLIENFEPGKIGSGLMRWLTRLGGVQDPDGGMPRDMRLSFAKPILRNAVETMIGWDPARIVLAHGRWYERDGAAELRRAFGWLL
jgi:hypothetical protein